MAAWQESSPRLQKIYELGSDCPRARLQYVGGLIVAQMFEVDEIYEHTVLPHAPTGPAMSARANSDPHIFFRGELHSSYNLRDGAGTYNGQWKAVRHAQSVDSAPLCFILLG